MAWMHSCVAIDSTLNHFTVVVNGKQVEDKSFPIPEGAKPPTDLTEKLLIFKQFIGFWYRCTNKVSNLNIFSKLMTLPEMVKRTAGDDCGKADGDYLDWESSEWILRGKSSLGEVSSEDLCRKESRIQLFTAPMGQLDQCKNLCPKMGNGTIASVRTLKEYQEMFDRHVELLYTDGKATKAGALTTTSWTSIRQASDGSWVDLYNKEPVKEITWAKGHPKLGLDCAILFPSWKGLASFQCTVNPKVAPLMCPCFFSVRPQLTLRGLCTDSHIDQAYLARNDPFTGFLFFYGTHKTIARFDGKKWNMLSAVSYTHLTLPTIYSV